MIQLQAVKRPTKLTDELVKELTDKYNQATDKKPSVWKIEYITKTLLKMSFDKCCFCECKVDEEGKYPEVEHFHPKSLYPNEVILWKNLLPICSRCNKKKSNHDTKKEPIVHPIRNAPKEHLILKDSRLYGISPLGKKTVAVVYLNDRKRLVNKRHYIGTELSEALEKLLKYIEKSDISNSIEDKNEVTGTLESLMSEGTKKYEYSATAATIILNDPHYIEIKKLFEDRDLWTSDFLDFKKLEEQVQFCALDAQ